MTAHCNGDPITEAQARRAAELAHDLRPSLHVAGLMAALKQLRDQADALDLAAALFALAANPEHLTPARLPQVLQQVQQRRTTQAQDAPRCQIHPAASARDCPDCAREARPAPDNLRELIAAAKQRHQPASAEQEPTR